MYYTIVDFDNFKCSIIEAAIGRVPKLLGGRE